MSTTPWSRRRTCPGPVRQADHLHPPQSAAGRRHRCRRRLRPRPAGATLSAEGKSCLAMRFSTRRAAQHTLQSRMSRGGPPGPGSPRHSCCPRSCPPRRRLLARRALRRAAQRHRPDRCRLRPRRRHLSVGALDRRAQRGQPQAAPIGNGNDRRRRPGRGKEAVDYFGALQVVGAAFLFGLSAARRLKR